MSEPARGTGDDPPWVRRAGAVDAEWIGEVQVRAWRAVYRGLLPQEYLDGLDVGERRAFWRRTLADPPPGGRVLVVCSGAGVVGFAALGPDDAPDSNGTGRLYAINVDPIAWGTGAASVLITAVHEQLAAEGYREAVLWVLPGNTCARRFYERHGWANDAVERPNEIFGREVPELRYRRTLAPSSSG